MSKGTEQAVFVKIVDDAPSQLVKSSVNVSKSAYLIFTR